MRYNIAIMFLVVILKASNKVFLNAVDQSVAYIQSPVISILSTIFIIVRMIFRFISGGNNTDIPVALIGALGVVVAALIAAGASMGVVLYQNRHNGSSNGSRKWHLTKKRRVQTYRNLLRADPQIASLQILDMTRPISISSIYVRLRLYQDTRFNYELEPDLIVSEAHHDPNALLAASQRRLENRMSKALEPAEAVLTYKRCVVVGDPGAGKTTLLKFLALKSANGQLPGLPNLPIHIGLNTFVSSGKQDLLDYASTRWEERYGISKEKARIYMEKRLETGKALLLLDALDETAIGSTIEESEASYRRVSDAIIQLSTRYHQTLIVVTARKAGYHQRVPLPGFTELEVLDFRSEDIWLFIYKWFASYRNSQKGKSAEDLMVRLQRNPRIQALAANPLLLSLIVIVYEAQLDLPDRRAELYKQCVETLLTKWDASRDIRRRRDFKPEHKRQLLEEIAWYFHVQGRRYFPEDELLRVIANFLPAVGLKREQNTQILEEIAAENGLLKEQAKGWNGFLHLTLQEYFVAQYVVDHNKLNILLAHRGNPWWEEVILLYAGQTPDASLLFQSLLGLIDNIHLREDIFYTNLILAGSCLAARPTIRQANLREEVITRLFKVLNETNKLLIGQQIADILVEINGITVTSRLVALLSNHQINLRVRESTAKALGRLGDTTIVPALVEMLSEQHIESEIRASIAEALGRLGDTTIVPALVEMLSEQHIESEIRASIAEALGRLGDTIIVPALISLLFDKNKDLLVRAEIAETLGELGDRTIVPQLLRLLSNPELNSYVRGSVAETLGELGDRTIVPQLLRLLSNPELDPYISICIVDSLGELGDHSIVSQLLQLISRQQFNYLIEVDIIQTMGGWGDRSIASRLVQFLSNTDMEHMFQKVVFNTLGNLHQQVGGDKIYKNISSWADKCTVRTSIVGTIAKLGELSVLPDLLQLLSNPQVELKIRQSIAETIGKLGERSVLPDLLQHLSNPQMDPKICLSIINAIGQFADDEATVQVLVELIEKPEISNEVYQALWLVSRRAGVRIFTNSELNNVKLETVKW